MAGLRLPKKAAGLAEELYRAPGVKAKLIPGSNGIFDVSVNREHMFSKSETGHFPEPREIAAKMKQDNA